MIKNYNTMNIPEPDESQLGMKVKKQRDRWDKVAIENAKVNTCLTFAVYNNKMSFIKEETE